LSFAQGGKVRASTATDRVSKGVGKILCQEEGGRGKSHCSMLKTCRSSILRREDRSHVFEESKSMTIRKGGGARSLPRGGGKGAICLSHLFGEKRTAVRNQRLVTGGENREKKNKGVRAVQFPLIVNQARGGENRELAYQLVLA